MKTTNNRDTSWVTPVIKILCDLKKDCYLLNKQYNNQTIKNSYKFICNIEKNIKDTKRAYINIQIMDSTNKIRKHGILLKL
jgi:hypothetical protein